MSRKHSLLLLVFTAMISEVRSAELVVCGWNEVFILEWSDEAADGRPLSPQKSWRWKASASSELPGSFRDLFRTTDECKPIDGGRRLLITSSAGGAALVEISTQSVLWFGRVANAHSIELLPEGRVAVAGSTNEKGNKLAIFDLAQPDKELLAEELYSGHGVVWDSKRQLLWALGYEFLYEFRLLDWRTKDPKLERVAKHYLPDSGGHDLFPVPGSGDLVVTTNRRVFLFNRDSGRFRPHPEIGDYEGVKGVSLHPTTGRLVYVQAEGGEWWASNLHFLNPSSELSLPAERIYKARWIVR
jgi:hypothetical protein